MLFDIFLRKLIDNEQKAKNGGLGKLHSSINPMRPGPPWSTAAASDSAAAAASAGGGGTSLIESAAGLFNSSAAALLNGSSAAMAAAAAAPDPPPGSSLFTELLDVSREFAWLAGGGLVIGLAFGFLTTYVGGGADTISAVY